MGEAPAVDPVAALEEGIRDFRRIRHQLDQAIAAAELELRNLRRQLRQPMESSLGSRADPDATDTEKLDPSGDAPVPLSGSGFGEAQLRYLDAGARLIQEAYGLLELDRRRAPAEETAFGGDLLAFIKPKRVTERAGRKSVSSFYVLWPEANGGRDAYVIDLLRYVFTRLDNFIRRPEPEENIPEVLRKAVDEDIISETVHRLAAQAMKRDLLEDPLWYLQLTLSALLHPANPRTPVLRQCVALLYSGFDEYYEPKYQEFMESYKLKIRESKAHGETSYEAIAEIIGALSEGLALRHQSKASQPDEAGNLFGLALLALMDGLVVDPQDPQPEDDLTIEERVARKFERIRRRRRADAASGSAAPEATRNQR